MVYDVTRDVPVLQGFISRLLRTCFCELLVVLVGRFGPHYNEGFLS